MAKNLFINTTGLAVEKEMPSLIGMDLSGVNKEPLKLDIGKTISDFATKAQAVKEQANYTKIYNMISDMENEWQIKNTTDPSAFSGKDKINYIIKSYNDLIEQKKAILSESKQSINATQYANLERAFKQTTYDSLYKLQNKIDSSYIQETLEDIAIERNALIIKCQNTDNINEIQEYENLIAGCFAAEKSLGLENRQSAIKTIMTIDNDYMQRMIVDNIINNNEDSSLFKTDSSGVPMLDSNGNNIRDTNKIYTKVQETRKQLLSKENIQPHAKRLAQSFGIPEKEMEEYIYNARNEFFKVKQDTIESNLYQKGVIEEAKLQEVEEKIRIKNNENIQKANLVVDKQGSPKELNAITNEATDNTIFYNNIFYKSIYGDNNIQETINNGNFVSVLAENELKDFSDKIIKAEDFSTLQDTIDIINKNLNNDPNLTECAILQFQQQGINAGLMSALLGKNPNLSTETAQQILLLDKKDNMSFGNVNPHRLIKFDNEKSMQRFFKYLDTYGVNMLSARQQEEYLLKTSGEDKYVFWASMYKKSNMKEQIDSIANSIKEADKLSNRKRKFMNKDNVIDYVSKSTLGSQYLINAKTIEKSGIQLQSLMFSGGNLIWYPYKMVSAKKPELNALNNIIFKQINDGKSSLMQVDKYNNGQVFKENYEFFEPKVIEMIDNGKFKDDNELINGVPDIFYSNNPSIRKKIDEAFDREKSKI